MRVTNQGGSLAGFIIIGVLLTLILVGGLFGLNRYNAQRAADEIAASEKANSEESSESGATKTEAESTDTSTQSRTEQAPTASTQQAQPQATQSTGAAQSAQLPQTGPADSLIGLIAVAALTFAVVHYTRSRA